MPQCEPLIHAATSFAPCMTRCGAWSDGANALVTVLPRLVTCAACLAALGRQTMQGTSDGK